MNLSELLGIAWSSVRVNRLSSALTTLGVVIGVSAVVILVGLGDGMKSGFNAQFGALSNKIVVTKLQGSVAGGGQAHDLKDSDAAALISPGKAPDIAAVTAAVAETDLLYYQQQQFRVTLTGARQDYLDMANRTLAVGSFFT